MKYINTLTLSYPGVDIERIKQGLHPKVFILFTAVSPYENRKEDENEDSDDPNNIITGKELIDINTDIVINHLCFMIEQENGLIEVEQIDMKPDNY